MYNFEDFKNKSCPFCNKPLTFITNNKYLQLLCNHCNIDDCFKFSMYIVYKDSVCRIFFVAKEQLFHIYFKEGENNISSIILDDVIKIFYTSERVIEHVFYEFIDSIFKDVNNNLATELFNNIHLI